MYSFSPDFAQQVQVGGPGSAANGGVLGARGPRFRAGCRHSDHKEIIPATQDKFVVLTNILPPTKSYPHFTPFKPGDFSNHVILMSEGG